MIKCTFCISPVCPPKHAFPARKEKFVRAVAHISRYYPKEVHENANVECNRIGYEMILSLSDTKCAMSVCDSVRIAQVIVQCPSHKQVVIPCLVKIEINGVSGGNLTQRQSCR